MHVDIEGYTIDIKTATRLSSLGFGVPTTDEFKKDVENHVYEGKQYVISDKETGEKLGFANFREIDDVLYLAALMLLPKAQGHGLAEKVIAFAKAASTPNYLALRTQNPRMWSVGQKVCSNWQPNPNGMPIPDHVLVTARKVEADLKMTFPTSVSFYPGALYGAKPTHRDPEVQRWWDTICSFQRGDSVLCVGQF